MISDLHSERATIMEAIDVLERFAKTRGKRRGRPPIWLEVARSLHPDPSARRKSVRGEETRKRMAEAQRKRWAAYREAKAVSAP